MKKILIEILPVLLAMITTLVITWHIATNNGLPDITITILSSITFAVFAYCFALLLVAEFVELNTQLKSYYKMIGLWSVVMSVLIAVIIKKST